MSIIARLDIINCCIIQITNQKLKKESPTHLEIRILLPPPVKIPVDQGLYIESPQLLFIVMVKSMDTYAFMDEGSALTLLDEDVARSLGLSGEFSPLCLQWTGNVPRMEQNQVVIIEVSARMKDADAV